MSMKYICPECEDAGTVSGARADLLKRETHGRRLDKCRYGDATCAVCGCGGLCDSKTPCPMQRRPLP